jgi:hypothetical protein
MLKREGIISILILSLLFLTSVVLAQESNSEELFARIIDFVVERDPALQAQEGVMEAAQRLSKGNTGENDLIDIPVYVESSLRERELDSALKFQEAQQSYSELKRKLVTEVFNNITEIFTLKNRVKDQEELHKLLEERKPGMERQVQAGIIDPGALRELSEKIIFVQTVIADAGDRIRILRMETAFNYGGEDWSELLGLLEELENIW